MLVIKENDPVSSLPSCLTAANKLQRRETCITELINVRLETSDIPQEVQSAWLSKYLQHPTSTRVRKHTFEPASSHHPQLFNMAHIERERCLES